MAGYYENGNIPYKQKKAIDDSITRENEKREGLTPHLTPIQIFDFSEIKSTWFVGLQFLEP